LHKRIEEGEQATAVVGARSLSAGGARSLGREGSRPPQLEGLVTKWKESMLLRLEGSVVGRKGEGRRGWRAWSPGGRGVGCRD
jgi:hypothetical protein